MVSLNRRAFLYSCAVAGIAGCSTPTMEQGSDRRTDGLSELSGSWKMAGSDAQNTGYARTGSGPGTPVGQAWVDICAAEVGDIRATPAITSDTLFLGCGQNLHAFDLETGETRWTLQVDYYAAFHSPAVSNDVVIFSGGNGSTGRVWGIDIDDGSVRWTKQTGAASSPITADGVVYWKSIRNSRPRVHAVDALDGTELWTFRPDCETSKRPVPTYPAVSGDRVYVSIPCPEGSNDPRSRLYAVGTAKGNTKWTFEKQTGGLTAPAVADGSVFVGDKDGNLTAVSTNRGGSKWEYETKSQIRASPSATGETVCVSTTANELHAVRPTDGTRRWRAESPSIVAKPMIAVDTIYLGGGYLKAVSLTDGSERWRFTSSNYASTGYSSPAIIDGALAVANCTKQTADQRRYDNSVHLLQ